MMEVRLERWIEYMGENGQKQNITDNRDTDPVRMK